MIGTPFVVDENPYVCWDWHLREKNLEFLQGIDAHYFRYVVESNAEHLDGDNKHRAALSIRLAYSQALETLFALLGSAVQAPRCPLGWMLAYRTELPRVVRKITNGEVILTRSRTPQFSWESISATVHARMGCEEPKKDWIQKGFGECWARFATEFLNPHFATEYNSMKHGLRGSLGGFVLAVGTEEVPGVPASADAMRGLSEGIFGAAFFEREKVGEKSISFRPRRRNRNWSPENLFHAVIIAAMSINNVASCLRILNGDEPKKCQFWNPESAKAFESPWAKSVGVIDASIDTEVTEADISPTTKDEVFASYRQGDVD